MYNTIAKFGSSTDNLREQNSENFSYKNRNGILKNYCHSRTTFLQHSLEGLYNASRYGKQINAKTKGKWKMQSCLPSDCLSKIQIFHNVRINN